MTIEPAFIAAIWPAPRSGSPSSAAGACRVITSAVRMRSSSDRADAPNASTASESTYGSWTMTSIPMTLHISATRRPTAPNPTTPRVLPDSSAPLRAVYGSDGDCQRPPRTYRSLSDIRRATASISPIVSSATALALRPGVLRTTTPWAVAASTSIWFSAARQIAATFRFSAAANVSSNRKSRSMTTASNFSLARRAPSSSGSHITPVSRQSSCTASPNPLMASRPASANGARISTRNWLLIVTGARRLRRRPGFRSSPRSPWSRANPCRSSRRPGTDSALRFSAAGAQLWSPA